MSMAIRGQVGPQTLQDGSEQPFREGRSGELVVTELHGRYYEQSFRGNVFLAQAIVTAPVIFSTAAATGGPLLWNPSSSKVNLVLLKASIAITTATSVAGALGITGNTGQTSAPTSTTTIDGNTAAFIGGATGQVKAYRIGTPTNAGNFLLPLFQVHTGAVTVDTTLPAVVDLEGSIIVPPGAWASLAASATLTSGVFQVGLMWEEVPA